MKRDSSGGDGGFRASGATAVGLPEIAGYAILERIGKGGMGEVYVARQLALGRLVAIKFLVPEGESDREDDLARFRLEAELMARVSHPYILPIFDFGEVDGRPYLVLEYVEGGDLRRRMCPGQASPTPLVLGIVKAVGEALEYLHGHKIIHRDLKPENILLQDGVRPRVSDFGVALLRANAAPLTRTGWGAGTLGYIAPEQQYRLKVDERADQYSLAALAYEMLTGHLPLGIFKPPTHSNDALGPGVDAAILRALQEDPNDRFPTTLEFVAALEKGLTSAPEARRRPALRRLAWGGLAVLAAATLLYAARPDAEPTQPRHPPAPVAWKAVVPIRSVAIPTPTPITAPSPPAVAVGDVGKPRAAVTDPVVLGEVLKKLRAQAIWKARGSPTGLAGEAVKDAIWAEASRGVEEDLKTRAYLIWQTRGSPTGPAGEAIKDEIWAAAQRQLYKELTGGEYQAASPP